MKDGFRLGCDDISVGVMIESGRELGIAKEIMRPFVWFSLLCYDKWASERNI